MKLECRRKQLLLQPATQLAEAVPPGVPARLFRRKGVCSGLYFKSSRILRPPLWRKGGRDMVSDDRKAELIGVTASCLAHRVEARLINEYGIAFFDRYLNELPQQEKLGTRGL
jgi:hypothetical protein